MSKKKSPKPKIRESSTGTVKPVAPGITFGQAIDLMIKKKPSPKKD